MRCKKISVLLMMGISLTLLMACVPSDRSVKKIEATIAIDGAGALSMVDTIEYYYDGVHSFCIYNKCMEVSASKSDKDAKERVSEKREVRYLGFKPKATYGMVFNSLDSFKNHTDMIGPIDTDIALSGVLQGILPQSIMIAKKTRADGWEETYLVPPSKDSKVIKFWIQYNTALPQIPYSFSPTLEKQKQARIQRVCVQILWNSDRSKPPTNITYNMHEERVSTTDKVLRFFPKIEEFYRKFPNVNPK